MRRLINKLNEKAALDLIHRQSLGRLGCVNGDGEPYVVPVNYLLVDGEIVCHSKPGLKIEMMRENPNVCLQTDVIAPDGISWKSSIAFGRFEEIADEESRRGILDEFYRSFPKFTPVETATAYEETEKEAIVFRINIKRLTGVEERL